jgi:Tfp pilus assembly protein PilP
MTRLLIALAAVGWLGAAVAAQAPAPPAPAAPAAVPDNLPSPPADYTYSVDGRRDPFSTLMRVKGPVTDDLRGPRPLGAAGILVDEVFVSGIVLSNGSYVAMISGPTKQTYSVRAGAKLLDGTVQSITPRAVVILQHVSDPLSLEKQREVRKLLRTQEEGK